MSKSLCNKFGNLSKVVPFMNAPFIRRRELETSFGEATFGLNPTPPVTEAILTERFEKIKVECDNYPFSYAEG